MGPNEECHEFAKATNTEALPLLRTIVGAGVFRSNTIAN